MNERDGRASLRPKNTRAPLGAVFGALAGAAGVAMLLAPPPAAAWLTAAEVERYCEVLYGSAARTVERGGPARAGGDETPGAVSPDDAAERAAPEAAGDADSVVCVAYVQGFLAGVAANKDSLRGLLPPAGAEETFGARALRTRTGARLRADLHDRLAHGGYCVDPELSVVELLGRLGAYFEARSAAVETRHEALHEALVFAFPCPEQ
jgi:hypothetical protein